MSEKTRIVFTLEYLSGMRFLVLFDRSSTSVEVKISHKSRLGLGEFCERINIKINRPFASLAPQFQLPRHSGCFEFA
jgi:hypothetical protein